MKNIYIAFLCILSTIILTGLICIHVDEIGYDHYSRKGNTELKDLGHDLMPVVKSAYAQYLFMLIPIVFILFSSKREEITAELFIVVSIVLIIRGISVALTILPISNKADTAENALNHGVSKFTSGGYHDKMFSGHTAVAVVITMVLIKYGVWNAWGWLYPIFMGVWLIASREHYTADVFIGGVVAYMAVKCLDAYKT